MGRTTSSAGRGQNAQAERRLQRLDPGRYWGSGDTGKERTAARLTSVGLGKWPRHHPCELSGSEQRVAIALARTINAALILDGALSLEVLAPLRRIAAQSP